MICFGFKLALLERLFWHQFWFWHIVLHSVPVEFRIFANFTLLIRSFMHSTLGCSVALVMKALHLGPQQSCFVCLPVVVKRLDWASECIPGWSQTHHGKTNSWLRHTLGRCQFSAESPFPLCCRCWQSHQCHLCEVLSQLLRGGNLTHKGGDSTPSSSDLTSNSTPKVLTQHLRVVSWFSTKIWLSRLCLGGESLTLQNIKTLPAWKQFKMTELKRLNSTELNWIELNWIELNWIYLGAKCFKMVKQLNSMHARMPINCYVRG